MLPLRNTSLISAIQRVVGVRASTMLAISVKFISSSDSTFSYSPIVIDKLNFSQDYLHLYTDDITIEFHLASADYAKLYAHLQDLHMILTLKAVSEEGVIDLFITPMQQTYRAVIINPRDITKEITDASRRTEIDTTIKIRLIEDDIYTARQQSLHAVYQTMPVKDVLRSITNAFGLTTLEMIEPDNVHKYDHVVLPAMQTFANAYEWVQAKYGVYMCGMNHYYTRGVLYVYAPYDTSPVTAHTLSVYQAERGYCQGSSIFHRVTNGNTELVTNTIHAAHDGAVAAGENHGTAASYLRASEIVDGIVKVNPKTGARFVTDPALTIALNDPKLVASKTVKNKYATMTDNPFALASNIAMHQSTRVHIDWNHAVPYVLTPGQKVSYNSDENGLVRNRSGILEGITYTIGRLTRAGGNDVYACKASLTLRLDPIGTLSSAVTPVT